MRWIFLRDKPNDQGAAGAEGTSEQAGAEGSSTEQTTESGQGLAADGQDSGAESSSDSGSESQAKPGATGSVPDAGKVPWQTRRINQLTAQLREAQEDGTATKRDLMLANATIEALRKSRAQGETKTEAQARDPGLLPEDEVEKRATAKATEMASVKAFNDACNAVAEAGKGEFKDFQSKLDNFKQLGGLKPEFVQAALEAGDAHKILYALGNDLDEAARIMALSPLKQAVELTKMVTKMNAGPAISAVPKPVKPLRGTAAPVKDLADSKFATEDRRGWIEERNRQLAEKRKAG